MSALSTVSRRGFGHRALFAVVSLLSFVLGTILRLRGRGLGVVQEAMASTKTTEGGKRWGMSIDLDRCTGCGACSVACSVENNVPLAGPDPEMRGAEIHWMDILLPTATEGGSRVANADAIPLPCMHCENPPCVKVCPVGATYQTADGIVAQIYDRCIGCRFCQVACPYGRRYFNWKTPERPESYLNSLNPDVATRPQGIVEKCTFCHQRVRRLHEEAKLAGREPTDAELQHLPACAQACPAEAITFGNLLDPTSRVAKNTNSARAFRLLEHLGTRPKVTYLTKDRRQ